MDDCTKLQEQFLMTEVQVKMACTVGRYLFVPFQVCLIGYICWPLLKGYRWFRDMAAFSFPFLVFLTAFGIAAAYTIFAMGPKYL